VRRRPFPCATAWQVGAASLPAMTSPARRPPRPRCGLLDLLTPSTANPGIEDLEVMVMRSDGLLLLRLSLLPPFTNDARKERTANGRRMLLILPPPVGDVDFCISDTCYVCKAN
jgi:hypothetical protein